MNPLQLAEDFRGLVITISYFDDGHQGMIYEFWFITSQTPFDNH